MQAKLPAMRKKRKIQSTGSMTALLLAARDGCAGCIPILAEAGADVNATSAEDISGLVLALLPSCSTFMSDRMLVFSGIGAMPLMAMLVREAEAALAAGRGGRRERALIAAIVAIQLVLPVPITQARIAGIAAYSRPVESAVAALDDVPHVEGKTVVLVNAPNSLQATYVPQMRQARGLPTPRHTYTLGPDTGLPVSIRYRRSGPRSLEVSPSQPFAWSLFRDYAHPFAAGDVVALAGMEVRSHHYHGQPQNAS